MSILKLFFIALVSATVFSGCGTVPPYPDLPREGSATLSLEGTRFTHFGFMPNGEQCGGFLLMSAAQNPKLRADKTLLIEPSKRSAILIGWVGSDFIPPRGLSACHVILSFNLAPNGNYKLVTTTRDDKCIADIVALDSSPSPQVKQMVWVGWEVPSKCAVKQ